jgi:hypothetical protein
MSKHLTLIGIICFTAFSAFGVLAEKSTELYIPIGQSPGLSGKYTVMGQIDQVNSQNRTLKMSGASGTYTVSLTPHTVIYLDRSRAGLANTYGKLTDCLAGDKVEVKFKDNSPSKPVEWIKVQKTN